MTKAKPYKNVGRGIVDLHDGRALAPGTEHPLTPEEAAIPHNRQLIDAGLLVAAQHGKHTPKKGDDR